MIIKSLISERSLVYPANLGQTGTVYNGDAASSTTATAMTPATGLPGYGIDVTKCNRALVIITATGTSTCAYAAYITSGGCKANDVSLTALSGATATLTAAAEGSQFFIELDLRGAKVTTPSAATGSNNNQTWLWIQHTGADTASIASVILMDFENEPALDSEATPAPLSLAGAWPSTLLST